MYVNLQYLALGNACPRSLVYFSIASILTMCPRRSDLFYIITIILCNASYSHQLYQAAVHVHFLSVTRTLYLFLSRSPGESHSGLVVCLLPAHIHQQHQTAQYTHDPVGEDQRPHAGVKFKPIL